MLFLILDDARIKAFYLRSTLSRTKPNNRRGQSVERRTTALRAFRIVDEESRGRYVDDRER